MSWDTQGICEWLETGDDRYVIYSLPALGERIAADMTRLPFSLKVLLENVARHAADPVTDPCVQAFAHWIEERSCPTEIAYRPSRVLMQDFTGVPAVVDLAAMRDAVAALGGDVQAINPLVPVDLVIDHSLQIDRSGCADALDFNVRMEMERNRERYELLRWAQQAFRRLRVVPPGKGICHQVNLEHLAQVVGTHECNGQPVAFPDTLVGTDSHTPMVNGLAVLGWGVGGIEAEAAMLGQPISMCLPDVVGVRLTGSLAEGATATDLVLTVTERLRERGVVGKFVEYFGPGLAELPVADRATLSNMSPEYGATCGFFPVDEQTLAYLRLTGRGSRVELVEAYTRAQGLWRDAEGPDPVFSDIVDVDISAVQPSIAGPRRPQDRIDLASASTRLAEALAHKTTPVDTMRRVDVPGKSFGLASGDVVIAAITSCTNTSNPSVMVAAGLLARKARSRGLNVKPWVKTSLAPGSKVVSRYLEQAGLQHDLDVCGFHLVGYGCTTCIGNSGPLDPGIEQTIGDQNLSVASVLSGNRNFEGRIHAAVRLNYLMSPPLVVAYAIAGTMRIDLCRDPLGQDEKGRDVFLKDIWPTADEVAACVATAVDPSLFEDEYAAVFEGDTEWQGLSAGSGDTYGWSDTSTYIRQPPFFEGMARKPAAVENVRGARVLALLGDTITTDHISPAGSIAENSPAGSYLKAHGVEKNDFNSYGSRRGNHEVMMRGTFANIRIRNEMTPQREGGYTVHVPSGEELSIYDAAMRYIGEGTPLVVVGGKEYGTGSSRDWAAKGTLLLGVKAVIAESFERIHRSNLAGMGVLPLTFPEGVTRKTLALDGTETVNLGGLKDGITPGMEVPCTVTRKDGTHDTVSLRCRLETAEEVDYFVNTGILQKVIRDLVPGT